MIYQKQRKINQITHIIIILKIVVIQIRMYKFILLLSKEFCFNLCQKLVWVINIQDLLFDEYKERHILKENHYYREQNLKP